MAGEAVIVVTMFILRQAPRGHKFCPVNRVNLAG